MQQFKRVVFVPDPHARRLMIGAQESSRIFVVPHLNSAAALMSDRGPIRRVISVSLEPSDFESVLRNDPSRIGEEIGKSGCLLPLALSL